MLLVMHTAEIKGVFVSFHKNTVKQNIALTHLQRHTAYKRCINKLCFTSEGIPAGMAAYINSSQHTHTLTAP